jgi:hypothetical protein
MPPNIPKSVEEVLWKALARKPERRFESARAMEQALRGCLRELGQEVDTEQLAATLAALFPERSKETPALWAEKGRLETPSLPDAGGVVFESTAGPEISQPRSIPTVDLPGPAVSPSRLPVVLLGLGIAATAAAVLLLILGGS